MDEFEAFGVLGREVAAGRVVVGELRRLLDVLVGHLAAATAAFDVLEPRDGSDRREGAWDDYGVRDLYDALEDFGEQVTVALA